MLMYVLNVPGIKFITSWLISLQRSFFESRIETSANLVILSENENPFPKNSDIMSFSAVIDDGKHILFESLENSSFMQKISTLPIFSKN